ncbi:MAG: nitroreductase family protein [Sedimentisphaerales bacterium]
MNILDVIKTRRSVRRFSQEKLDRNLLIELVEAARCAPAFANVQSLEYIVVDEPAVCRQIFETLSWAGYVRPKRDPAPHQRPTAYIAVLIDTEIKKDSSVDTAAAIENILIGAWGSGIGSCWLKAIDRLKILEILKIDEKYQVDSVIALGKPAEKPVLEDATGEDIKYYLDKNDVLHVPKRPLGKILHINKFGRKYAI